MRGKFAVVIVALLGGLFFSGCSDIAGDSGNPIIPSGPSDQPTAIRPLSVNLSNGFPAVDGSTLPYDGSLVVDLQYSLSAADKVNINLSRTDVSVCLAGPAEGTVLITSCRTKGYQTTGPFYVSQANVNPSQRLNETYRLVYLISTATHSLTPNRAVPPNSANYPITELFDIVAQGQIVVRIVWGT